MKRAMRTLHVVIATPLGLSGKGGIDRIMDEVRAEVTARPTSGQAYDFIVTRGRRHIAFSALKLPLALAGLTVRRAFGRADLVHINLSSHGSTRRKLLLVSLCRRLGVPYVIHLHGSRMRQYWLATNGDLRQRLNSMFIDAARVIVLGEVWRRFVAEQVPAAADRIVILPNATRATRLLHEPASDVRILFLGQIGPRKGVPQLIEALSGLPHEVAWSAVIAGDGDLSESQAQITALGLSERVTLPGWVGPADVEVLFARSDILVLPSFDENLPMSVIEAMAAGLAVVTTPVGATEDIIAHGETGLLVPPGEVPPLREAIARLVADPELRFRLGEAARKVHAERLEITPYVDQLRRIWQEAAS